MYRWILGACLFLVAGYGQAQQVFKCVNGKDVSYQSDPCPGAAVKSWDAAPVSEPSNAEQWRIYRMRRQLDQRYANDRGASASGGTVSPNRSNACESARRGRAAAYEVAGVKRDFAMSSYWDNLVHNACK
ncbi:hypothetical protein ABB27_00900 [Stenotrophomonas terrae]|uniref:DUF4124 domain-containing protein n=1 Tax=Stenotrophomonas terrae TaxID=405446 RepID=A0A0R0CRI1_9GAMM|nr:hypothetical protein [Stenotrophomonas terrae]KRG72473.1 hypothetical protein ABB27_00900 [Stenotrophomonas terrae]